MISCSVEMSLLPLDEQRERWSLTDGPFVRPTTSVQLQTRHWIMRDENGEITSEVTGAGVLGKFPILVPGKSLDTVIVTAAESHAFGQRLQSLHYIPACLALLH